MNMCIHYIVAWLIYLQNLGGSKEVSYWLSSCAVVDGQMIMADQIRRLVRPYHDIYWPSKGIRPMLYMLECHGCCPLRSCKACMHTSCTDGRRATCITHAPMFGLS
jgi:hypothetical protein